MLDIVLKHIIYEKCIEVLFQQLEQNFVMPKITSKSQLLEILQSSMPWYTVRDMEISKSGDKVTIYIDIKY